MSGAKKHPLEVFRASSQRLGSAGEVRPVQPSVPRPADEPVADRPPAIPVAPATQGLPGMPPAPQFEVRLTLPGALLLLFAIFALAGVAHVYGYHRGVASIQGARDVEALARGRLIEEGGAPPAARPGGDDTAGAEWYGVLAITYNSSQGAMADNAIAILRGRYRFDDVLSWDYAATADRPGRIELMVGVSSDKRDPKLKDIQNRLHLIDDFPSTAGRPFATAFIQQHPNDPNHN